MHVMIDIMQVQLNKLFTKSTTIYICILNVNKIKKTIGGFYLGGEEETRVSFPPQKEMFPPQRTNYNERRGALYT